MAGHVVIFAPSPLVTVTLEDDAGGPDLHVHAGGQGVWQSRMLRTLGAHVTLCATLTGELGGIVRLLLEDDGVEVRAVVREGRGAGYVHDRRDGERESIAELDGDPLGRHDLDELYALTLREAMDADLVILSGPAADDTLPDDVYRRLAADLGAAGATVLVDLAGPRLEAALEGGVLLAKVSDEELVDMGRAADASTSALVRAAEELREAGAGHVLVSRAPEPALLVGPEEVLAVHVPQMEELDARGAGDSLTAALAAALVAGDDLEEAVALAVAAGALNVTRHGLGSGDAAAIHRMRERVEVERLEAVDGRTD